MFNRREFFFRGTALGAGGIFLSQFINQLEASEGNSPRPTRFVFLLQGNGLYPNQIQPEGIERPRRPSELEDRSLANHRLARSIDPLEPYKDRLALIHGLSGKITGPPSHSADFGALGCFPQRMGVAGETIDAALAKQLPSLFTHVGLGVHRERSVVYDVSAWERNKALPTQCNPVDAHRRLFAVAATGNSRRNFDARTNLLDFMSDDVRRLQRELNATERQRLDHYLHAFESMSERQTALVRAADRIREAAPRVDDRYTNDTRVFEHLQANLEIGAASLIAGLTNVLTITSGSGMGRTGISPDGSEIGLETGRIGSHAIGHGRGFQGQSSVELHIRIRRRYLELVAEFLNRLQNIPEGNGTMLDNTLVVYTSDSAEGHHPRCDEWPFILIGDLGGRLRTRCRYLRYPYYGNRGHRTVANLYTTFLHALGQRRPRFGLPDVALRDLNQDGPLSELMG